MNNLLITFYFIGVFVAFILLFIMSNDNKKLKWDEIVIGMCFSSGSWLAVIFLLSLDF